MGTIVAIVYNKDYKITVF